MDGALTLGDPRLALGGTVGALFPGFGLGGQGVLGDPLFHGHGPAHEAARPVHRQGRGGDVGDHDGVGVRLRQAREPLGQRQRQRRLQAALRQRLHHPPKPLPTILARVRDRVRGRIGGQGLGRFWREGR